MQCRNYNRKARAEREADEERYGADNIVEVKLRPLRAE
jgi:hypothetical protein